VVAGVVSSIFIGAVVYFTVKFRAGTMERRKALEYLTIFGTAASAATLYATGMTPVNLLFRTVPLEALALVALLWGISALPFYAVNYPLYRATGDYKFRLA